MTNAKRREAVLRHLASLPSHTARQRDIAATLGMVKADTRYTVTTLAADHLVKRSTDVADGLVTVVLVRCVPELGIHITPHNGCILR